MTHIAGVAEIGIVLIAASLPAFAVEGAVGRALPGAWVMPQGGVIGPHPGFSVTLMPFGYSATSGALEIPDAGLLEAEVSANVNLNNVVPQYVYKTKSPKISLATTFIVPVAWVGVTTAATGRPGPHRSPRECGHVRPDHVTTQRGNPLQSDQQLGNQPKDFRAHWVICT